MGSGYLYDQLNRLLIDKKYSSISGTSNVWNETNGISAYTQAMGYDANGNIELASRKGADAADMPLDEVFSQTEMGKFLNHIRSVHI